MMELNPTNARMLSRLGQRGSIFGLALPDLAQSRPDVRVLTADLALLSGLTKFQSLHPEKFLNLGIAEQNLAAVAAGLAQEGCRVFITTYATFLTMRAFEQLRHNLGYVKLNIKAVGSSAGLVMGMSGPTHYAVEDIALMRVIPNLTLLSPADAGEALKMACAAADLEGPVYLRLTGGLGCTVVHQEEYELVIGRARLLREGTEAAVLATGTLVHESLKAAEILAGRGLSVAVYNMHTLKPLDAETLAGVFQIYPAVVTVEEHSRLGGLGGAAAEVRAGLKGAAPLKILGLPDHFPKADDQASLWRKFRLSAPDLAEDIAAFCEAVRS